MNVRTTLRTTLRRTAPPLLVLALAVTIAAPAPALAGAPDPAKVKSLAATGANPYVSIGAKSVPGARDAGSGLTFGLDGKLTTTEVAAWQRALATGAEAATTRPGGGAGSYTEREPATVRGRNDTRPEFIRGVGSGRHESGTFTINGVLASETPPAEALAPPAEDDGAIPLATETGIAAQRRAITTSGTIGDGPHGTAGTGTGDFDFYELTGRAGEVVTADVDTPGAVLDSVAVLYAADGTLIGGNDDQAPPADWSSLFSIELPADGTYYVAVGGWSPGLLPADPNDPASGPGAFSEGPYELRVQVAVEDRDSFAVDLDKGDVLGLNITGGAARLEIFDPSGTQVFGSVVDLSVIVPPSSPLPKGGNAIADHIAEVSGRHRIVVERGAGAYVANAVILRPAAESEPRGTKQTLLIDTNGATIDPAIFNAGAEPGERPVTGLPAFLPAWGLTEADLPRLLEVMTRTVNTQLNQARRDARVDELAVRVVTSADGPETWGSPDTSRVIIGGTIEELGIPTVGIAQSIDPGNFAREETAIVLLDLLSGPAGDPVSLNTYLTPASDRVGFIGRVLGNLISHEAGHYLGNWHLTSVDDQLNIMDEGGSDPAFFFGVGPDGVGGTADDVFARYGPGPLSTFEGFDGTENTAVRTAWALVKPKGR
ncbi:hypothetical protein J2S43_003858 [Catenuloplanes nepalensis]|uniref:Peptidase C-terminal archaeal/bacterial domain-containing protein n=1 Tax=Catenuloplanes nepalensis TaxID=587533 RepID=A0ABT9MVQ6_9ACTN|nr:PPC domain-containing protein [Catenuloplanes nepalensis]MDP9795346.1 hypothetical protein [Catenuloplanes nepalensis]